ncbi:MAG: type VI secretion system tip protein VgrG [Polyangiaceae bacterium]|nr:type VI secretion system tip protein VgrG [Polyangiaceae bacterium]
MAQSVVDLFTEPKLSLKLSTDADIDVRHFSVREAVSSLFSIHLQFVSSRTDIDFDGVIGREASFKVNRGGTFTEPRMWSGVASNIEQIDIEDTEKGLSTYQVTLVPKIWLLTQRRNYRMFQQTSEPKIVIALLKEWGIEPELEIDLGTYKDRRYRVQYAESDFAFMSRMLEDAGIAFYFKQGTPDAPETKLVLSDRLEKNPPKKALPYVNRAMNKKPVDFATEVQLTRQVRPGVYTQRDHDYRRAPGFPLIASAQSDHDIESMLERYHYNPGSFLYRADSGDDSPTADDRGKQRTDLDQGASQVQKRLQAKRLAARLCVFRTNMIELKPGDVTSIDGYPRTDLENKPLLIIATNFSGDWKGDWAHMCEARFTDQPYRPPLLTTKPKVEGVESATVVGPAGEEIHTDEFGRVRVHFHWDRESKMNEQSSCWIHVSQPWGGTGYGGMNIPRIGQEVIVDFLGGDPDRPVIVGRVYTNLQKVPYPLPANKTKSGWRSNSSPGGGGFNELMFEDAKGNELVRLQAEKDYTGLVKNNSGHVIGHDSQHHVGHDETRTVINDQTIKVGHDRKLRIQHDQAHVVDNSIIQVAVQGTTTNISKKSITSISEEEIVLRVGTSAIVMKPNEIKIQGDMVYINPNNVQLPAPPQPPTIDGVRQQNGHFFGAP